MQKNNILTPAKSRAARSWLGIKQPELAALAGVSHRTVVDFERGQREPTSATLTVLTQALLGAGIEFIEDDAVKGPGVRLSKSEQSD